MFNIILLFYGASEYEVWMTLILRKFKNVKT